MQLGVSVLPSVFHIKTGMKILNLACNRKLNDRGSQASLMLRGNIQLDR